MAMQWDIPVDVTNDDARLLHTDNVLDREQHVLFNPFYYTIAKAKLGSDGLTRKEAQVQKAVVDNLTRIELEGRMPKGSKKKGGGRRKGAMDKTKMFRLPSYFEIVHRPMSLQKIQRKLGTTKAKTATSSSS